MSVWSNFKLRLRLIGRAVVQSENHLSRSELHLSAIPRLETQIDRLSAAAEKIERHLSLSSAMTARGEILEIMADPRFDNPLRLERSGFRVHSQFDEDGIIDEIFRRIGTTNRVFVEFGAGNGTENCTGFLLMQGWRGLPTLELAWKPELTRGQLVARREFITVDNIDGIIRDAGFSGEIDLLCVDLDGNDYHFLENIDVVSPRVICAEYNGNIPSHIDWKMARKDDYVWDGLDDRTGASLKALETMLDGRGYALVGCGLAGVNAFFVRRDLTESKFAEPFTAENHYNPFRFFYAARDAVSNWREGSFSR
jgi:hypothetical protein